MRLDAGNHEVRALRAVELQWVGNRRGSRCRRLEYSRGPDRTVTRQWTIERGDSGRLQATETFRYDASDLRRPVRDAVLQSGWAGRDSRSASVRPWRCRRVTRPAGRAARPPVPRPPSGRSGRIRIELRGRQRERPAHRQRRQWSGCRSRRRNARTAATSSQPTTCRRPRCRRAASGGPRARRSWTLRSSTPCGRGPRGRGTRGRRRRGGHRGRAGAYSRIITPDDAGSPSARNGRSRVYAGSFSVDRRDVESRATWVSERRK